MVEPTKEERRSVEQELKKARKRWGSDEARWREQQQVCVRVWLARIRYAHFWRLLAGVLFRFVMVNSRRCVPDSG